MPSEGMEQLQATLNGEESAAKLSESAGTELLFPPCCGVDTKTELVFVLEGKTSTLPYWTANNSKDKSCQSSVLNSGVQVFAARLQSPTALLLC